MLFDASDQLSPFFPLLSCLVVLVLVLVVVLLLLCCGPGIIYR